MEVVVGVDSHKATFAAAVMDLIGRPVKVQQYSNDRRGYEEFLGWANSHGQVLRIGVEGSDLWGAGLTKFLLDAAKTFGRYRPVLLTERQSVATPRARATLRMPWRLHG